MHALWARLRSTWRALRRGEQLDAEMHEEMRFHIDMEADRLAREQGLYPGEARRQAHVRFGGLEKYKEHGRDTRGVRWVDALSVDARLGVRMLVKYRWLTLVGGFAIAVAIAIGAAFFEIVTELLNPALPLDDGGRVVALQYATSNPGNPERRVLHDFVAWREELDSIEQLGAFRTVHRNLVSGDAPPEPIKVAEITASGFAVARTAPLLGRYLVPADERQGAPHVVVIGHQAWQSRFAGDPHIVGRTINLGGALHTVAGVMPEGFRFPLDHQFWIPLRANPLEYERLQGPQLHMFGRLAPGVTMRQAQEELAIVGHRAAVAYPDSHERLRPVVLPFTREHLDLSDPGLVWVFRIAQLLVGALVFVVAVNLAILIYARTATRLGEIAVRTALGATRRRILGQLFVEALALTIVGAAAGLVLAHVAIDVMQSLIRSSGGIIPFWTSFDLSVGTVIYALGLAMLAAVIMGVLPGLKATSGGLTATLHELNGRTGTRLGPMWTTLVVAQIAVAVAVLPMAAYLSWRVVQVEVAGPGFAAEEFVVGTVALSDEADALDSNRLRRRQLELMSRLEAEPGVADVTFSSSVPGFGPGGRGIEFEAGVTVPGAGTAEVSTIDIGLGIFATYDVELLAGRAFDAGDPGAANAVIVNRTFVRRFLDSSATLTYDSALGRRFRYSGPRSRRPRTAVTDEWYQIVGIVADFPSFRPAVGSEGEPTVYHAAAPGDVHPVVVSVRFSGPIPGGVAERFRRIGAQIDPALQLRNVVPLSNFYDDVRSFWRYLAWGIGMVTASVLLLSAAGIYALMAFTVAQRAREIGIRAALGAAPHRLLLSIFGRVTRQLAIGVAIGSLVSVASLSRASPGLVAALLLAVAAIMLAIGLVAALGPARRCLSIQPIDALRADG